jgi:DNA-binding NarL/FixJ family response regulator
VTVRVVVVDDDPMVRTGLGLILGGRADLDVVGSAADGAAALALVTDTRPDVVVMDIRMPVMDGIEATRRIAAGNAPTRVLVLTTFDLDEYVFGALQAGASGFLLKDTRAEDLIAAVQTIAAGEAVVAPSVTRRLIAHFLATAPGPAPRTDRLDVLTAREREVLSLIAHGRSNTEIAHDLNLSPSTVSTHINRLLAKLNLRDRVQAVILGYECGLVPRADP